MIDCSAQCFELLNSAAFEAPAVARAAWEEWCKSHSLDALDATSSLILPAIRANLTADGFSGEIDERARLDGVTRHWRVRRHLQLDAADQMAETLRLCGRRNALTGGVAIDAHAYSPENVRPGYEVAVLVENASLCDLVRAIAVEGWQVLPSANQRTVTLATASEMIVERENARVTLRWNLLHGERRPVLDAKELQRTVLRDGRTVVRAEAVLLSLLADPRTRRQATSLWEADVRGVTQLPGLDFAAVAAMARSRSASCVLAHSLAYLRSRGVAPFPSETDRTGFPNFRWGDLAFDFRTRIQGPTGGATRALATDTIRRGSRFLAVTRDLSIQERAKVMGRSMRRSRLPGRSEDLDQ